MNYLSICCIAKDEDLLPDHRGKTYIEDFVDMHLFLGVEKIYIYDQTGSLLLRYKNHPYVRVFFYPRPHLQADAYLYHIQTHLNDSLWTMFLDVDEFAIPNAGADIKEVLARYENIKKLGCIQFNWKVFGSNHHVEKPALSQFEAFTRREDDKREGAISRHTKCAVRRKAVMPDKKPADPHHMRMERGCRAVNAAGQYIVPQPLIDPIYNNLAVYHYVTRSHFEYKAKCQRGRVDFIQKKEYPAIEQLDVVLNEIEDLRAKEVFYLMEKAGF